MDDTQVVPDKIVYIMRGLPACGKSHTARCLKGENGVICEPDNYFKTEVGHNKKRYNTNTQLRGASLDWAYEQFLKALAEQKSPIILDFHSNLNEIMKDCIRHAIANGYKVKIKEPESPWWREVRPLLNDRRKNINKLATWAKKLSKISRRRDGVKFVIPK